MYTEKSLYTTQYLNSFHLLVHLAQSPDRNLSLSRYTMFHIELTIKTYYQVCWHLLSLELASSIVFGSSKFHTFPITSSSCYLLKFLLLELMKGSEVYLIQLQHVKYVQRISHENNLM